MQKLGNPMPTYLDARGELADGGYIYVGPAEGDPVTDQLDLFWDASLTIPATQPLRTLGGYVVNGVIPSLVFLAESDYAMTVQDNNHTQVFYSPSVYTDTDSFQPASAELTAIAALTTTPFGRSLLTLANSAALATATGIPAPLPLAGGALTGNATRAGAGVLPYWYDPAMTGGRIFLTAEGDPDPTSLPGDLWFTY